MLPGRPLIRRQDVAAPPKQRSLQSDTDFVLPNYEQLLRPQHRVSPQGGSRSKISMSLTPPAGSPLSPLSQQASSPTNPRYLGLIHPPILAISRVAPWYFFSTRQTKGNHTLRSAVQIHRGGNGSCSPEATAWQATAPAVPGRKPALGLLLLSSTTRATSGFPIFHALTKIK